MEVKNERGQLQVRLHRKDNGRLKRYGHLVRMDKDGLTKMILEFIVGFKATTK